ncbi:hypothetical protein CsSME_00049897 [Camellia sinensis var. sinensis]
MCLPWRFRICLVVMRYSVIPELLAGYDAKPMEVKTRTSSSCYQKPITVSNSIVKVPAIPRAPATAPAPSLPPPAAKRRERWAPARNREERRSRGWRSPLKPVLSDDNAETSGSEEAVSPQPESSESGHDSGSRSGGDDESGSGADIGDDSSSSSASESDNGADGDSSESPPKKRTKRASRTCEDWR